MTAGSGEALRQQLSTVLHGIDRDECESDDGWWPTSTGVEFGRRRLDKLTVFVADLVAAVRVATATEIAEALEARLDATYPALTLISVRDAAALAREVGGSVPAPKGDQ